MKIVLFLFPILLSAQIPFPGGGGGGGSTGGSGGSGGTGSIGSGSITDFTTTKVSSTVITVAAGTYRYGTNPVIIPGTITYTLQTVSITGITPSASLTTIQVSPAITSIQNGQAINVNLTGTGDHCANGTGVFVATTIDSTHFYIPADTLNGTGCTSVSGTVGGVSGGTAIIFGNNAGQIEMSISASIGALLSVSGSGGVVSQTSTGLYPVGSIPIASVNIAVGLFDTAIDYRSFISNMTVQGGAGIEVTTVGGQAQVQVASNVAVTDAPTNWLNSVIMKDATKTHPWRTGTGSPDARDNCLNIGEAYFQSDALALWGCTATGTPGTWTIFATNGTLPYISSTFTTSTHATITAGTHGFLTKGLAIMVYDTSGNLLAPDGNSGNPVTVNPSTYQVDIYFASPTTFIVAIMGGIGQRGIAGAAGAGFTATSTTSLATGTGSKTLTTQTGLAHSVGGCIQVISAGTPTDFMIGRITAYDTSTGSLTFTSAARTAGTCSGTVGSGTHTDWNLSANGVAGADGGGSGTITSIVVTAPLTGGTISTSGTITAGNLPTRSACAGLGADNSASDLVDADLGPQGDIFKIPTAVTVVEVSVKANAGTPSLPILQKNHWGGSSWSATDITSAVLPTGAAGIETCASTASTCASGVTKSGSVTVVTAGSANVIAAGDYIQTKTGSGFASSGAKRLTFCVTYTVN